MVKSPPPPPCVALTILRVTRGWTQPQLAGAANVNPGTISDYERGHVVPSRKLLRKLVRQMSFPPDLADETIAEVERRREMLKGSGAQSSGAVLQQRIDTVAERIGKAHADVAREALTLAASAVQDLEERQIAKRLWLRLGPYDSEGRKALLRDGREFQTWGLSELLCAESIQASAVNADDAGSLANLALEVANRVEGSEEWQKRLRGYAWAHFGNALRVSGKLKAADEAFSKGEQLWRQGAPGDPGVLDAWRVPSLGASLRREQGRFQEALQLLDQAESGSTTSESAAHIALKRSTIYEAMGDFNAAQAALRSASSLLPASAPFQLRFSLVFNSLVLMWRTGDTEGALARLPEAQALVEAEGGWPNKLRLAWFEARIDAARGRLAASEAKLENVRREFERRGIAYEAALVSLELAALATEGERYADAKRLARAAAPVFEAEGVHHTTLSAWKALWKAAQEERLTLKAAYPVLSLLEGARQPCSWAEAT